MCAEHAKLPRLMAQLLVIPVFIPHQGCRHRCTFCNQHLITHDALPEPHAGLPGKEDLHRIITEYLSYKGNRTRVELAFFGGNFLGLARDRILELLHAAAPYLEKGLIQGIRCSTRPDTVTPDIVRETAALGMTLVELGVQSMDNVVLETARRGHTREDTLSAVDVLKSAGMAFGVQLMVGLPGDSHRKALDTADEIAGLSPAIARIYPVLVLAGSPLAGWFREGKYRPLDLDEAVLQVKDMALTLERNGVRVIRMGLQDSPSLTDPARRLAGPYHPAFGHLVRSAMMRDQAEELLGGMDLLKGERIGILVHPRDESRLRGDRNANLGMLTQTFPGCTFVVIPDPVQSPGQLRLKALP